MNRIIFISITVLFFTVSGYLGFQTQQKLDKFQRYKIAYTSELNFQTSFLDIKDYVIEGEWDNSKKESIDKFKKAKKAKNSGANFGILLGGWIIIYLLVFAFLYRKKKASIKQISLVVLNGCAVLLGAGLVLPLIELGAYMEDLSIGAMGFSKTFNGKIYFFYQCKSILNLISTLFQNQSYVVGVAILLFSVIAPIAKLIAFYIFLISSKIKTQKNQLNIISYIGKYSMVDVFVAANFLSYLAFNSMSMNIKTESSTLLGLYFFLGYCIISIGMYFFIKKQFHPVTTPDNS